MDLDIRVDAPAAGSDVEILGIPLAWQPDQGTCTLAGIPCVMLWTPTSLAEFAASIHRAAGAARYPFLMQAQGRKGVDDDWAFMQSFGSFQEGLRAINRVATVAGWGSLELVSYVGERREAVMRIHNSWEASFQRALGVCWGTHYFAGKLAGWFGRHFATNCWATQQRFFAAGDAYDEFLIVPSSRDVEQELAQIVREEAERQQQLETLVAQRTNDLQAAVAELEATHASLRDYAQTIQQLSTPVIQLWSGILMVPLVGHVDDARAQHLLETLLVQITERSAEIVLIDITGVSAVDTSVANHLLRTIRAARLLGAYTMLVGISSEVAQTIVTLGLDLTDVDTSSNLQHGLQKAFARIGRQIGPQSAQ